MDLRIKASATIYSLIMALSLFFARCAVSSHEVPPQALEDPLKQRVSSVELVNEDITTGIAKLNQVTTGIAFAIEFPLGRTISAPAPKLKTLVATVEPGSLQGSLDRLCDLDATFVWQRIGNTIHLIPRGLQNDPSYVLNRKIGVLEFTNMSDAQRAVFQVMAQLPAPKEQIAMMQTGLSVTFSRPWSASFKDVTVREAFDNIARELGPTHGWQFTGAADFRLIVFHERLSVKPRDNKQPSS